MSTAQRDNKKTVALAADYSCSKQDISPTAVLKNSKPPFSF